MVSGVRSASGSVGDHDRPWLEPLGWAARFVAWWQPGLFRSSFFCDATLRSLASSRVSEAVMTCVRREYRVAGHLEMLREVAETFPDVPDPSRYESAWIWHCGFRSLSGLSRLRNLRKLEVAGYPDASLDPLRPLNRLEHLSMVHLPGVTNLTPLNCLAALRRLTLAALPAHDPASAPVDVESLAPLGSLPALEEVNLFGVRPLTGRYWCCGVSRPSGGCGWWTTRQTSAGV